MNKELEQLLAKEVKSELEAIEGIDELGTDQHYNMVENVNKMMDRLNESQKIENEAKKLDIEREKLEVQKVTEDEKLAVEKDKLKFDKRDRLVKNIITGVTFVISLGVTIWANIDSKNFEREDTHTTESGRSSQRKLLGLLDKFRA